LELKAAAEFPGRFCFWGRARARTRARAEVQKQRARAKAEVQKQRECHGLLLEKQEQGQAMETAPSAERKALTRCVIVEAKASTYLGQGQRQEQGREYRSKGSVTVYF
jgi:hypothetical protein